ncbi:MAG: ATP-binding cassette domain-containing protein [Rhizobiales bacterium]|nr:ATP-binding cassette domain-containing protein [Hyphomicrobiales bacterium]
MQGEAPVSASQDDRRAPVLAFEGVTKRFGAVVAARDVSFQVMAGEIVALVGENGAGKSTVVNLISGVLRPDEGRLRFGGDPVDFASPNDAVRRGVGVVHQHYTLTPTLSALNNIVLAMPELGLGPFSRKRLLARVARIADDLGFGLDLSARIDQLDVAHQQRVEIVKALLRDVRLLVLDEPTAVLGPADRRQFFDMLARLRQRGVAIVLITHKLDDVFSICERALVMRGGALVADRPTAQLDRGELVELMIGERNPALALELAGTAAPAAADSPGATLGWITGLTLLRSDGSLAVEGLSLSLHAGEILAVAGVDGNGQVELMRCLAGLDRPDAGEVELLGLSSRSKGRWSPRALRKAGLAHVPADRRRSGILEGRDLADNHLLCRMDDPGLVRGGFIRRRRLRDIVAGLIGEFSVKATGPGNRMGALSGGNQQKLVLARELTGGPRVLLVAYPSRGLDVRTTHFLHDRLRAARREGAAVVLVSGDLDEIWLLADRILVLAGGHGFGPVTKARTTPAQIGGWMAGHRDSETQAA